MFSNPTHQAATAIHSNGSGSQNQAGIIQMNNVVKEYETAAGPLKALHGIKLTVNAGEFLAVIGRSGSGKSTLINMITGIDQPTAGEVIVNNTAIHTMAENKLAKWRGRQLGVIFQFFQLLPTLTVLENIVLPMDFCKIYPRRERRDRAMHLLEMMGIAYLAGSLPAMISGGQQQRVAIARSLANDPPLLVADEPTGNLDTKTAESVFGLFETLVAQGKTIVMVTHDVALAQRAGRCLTVSDGQIVNQQFSQNGSHPSVKAHTIAKEAQYA